MLKSTQVSLVAALSLSAFACGGTPDGSSDPTESVSPEANEQIATTGDALKRGVAVSGTWANLAPDNLTADPNDPYHYTGTGGSVWTGTWNGTTTYTADYHFDDLGNVTGHLRETFTGTSGKKSGKIFFDDTVSLNGATGMLHIETTIRGGTRHFEDSRGRVTFDGPYDVNTGTGSGTYSGTWLNGDCR